MRHVESKAHSSLLQDSRLAVHEQDCTTVVPQVALLRRKCGTDRRFLQSFLTARGGDPGASADGSQPLTYCLCCPAAAPPAPGSLPPSPTSAATSARAGPAPASRTRPGTSSPGRCTSAATATTHQAGARWGRSTSSLFTGLAGGGHEAPPLPAVPSRGVSVAVGYRYAPDWGSAWDLALDHAEREVNLDRLRCARSTRRGGRRRRHPCRRPCPSIFMERELGPALLRWW